MKLTLEERLLQLQDSLGLISDALEKISSGDKKYFIVLGTQLRALLCSGGRNFHPLLIDIADEVNFPIICYGPRNKNPNDPLNKGLVFNLSGRVIGLEPFSPAQVRYELKDWMESYVLVVDGDFFTPNQILRTYGDKEASHYDKEVDKKLAKIKTIIFHRSDTDKINEVDRFLVLTGEYVVIVGQFLMDKML